MGIAADYPHFPEQSGKRIGPFTEYARAARATRLCATGDNGINRFRRERSRVECAQSSARNMQAGL
jgi:hypothetical protein